MANVSSPSSSSADELVIVPRKPPKPTRKSDDARQREFKLYMEREGISVNKSPSSSSSDDEENLSRFEIPKSKVDKSAKKVLRIAEDENWPDIPGLRRSDHENSAPKVARSTREMENQDWPDIPGLSLVDRENGAKPKENTGKLSSPDKSVFMRFRESPRNKSRQYTGTRPKVYVPEPCSPEPRENHEENFYPRNPTELPDFVQDHLVIEQSYMNQERILKKPGRTDLTFDLTDSVNKSQRRRDQLPGTLPISEVLDLPVFDNCNEQPTNSPESLRNDGPLRFEDNEILPDFLNDGLILNLRTEPKDRAESPGIRMSSEEYDRLRHDLENARRQANERLSRIMTLEIELESRRHAEEGKSTEQMEDNLKQSTRRALDAESTALSLREQIRSLQNEVSMLRMENTELRMAIGLDENSGRSLPLDRRISEVAQDLRSAASTAETSLRQLMSGVSNLRVLASTLENMDRIEDRTKDFLPDFDDENAAGPRL